MKKLILLISLFLFLFAVDVQAKEMKAPRLFVEIDKVCAPLTYVDNTIPNVIECLRNELTNPLNYSHGWSKYVVADIQLKLVGNAIEKYPIKTTSRQSEKIAQELAIPVIDKIYEMALDEIYKQPDANTIIPANLLRELRY